MAPVFFALLIGAAVFALLFVVLKWNQQRFEKRFPPISDEEFMSLCKPGTDPEVALKVRRIIADKLGIEYERVSPLTNFVEDIAA